MGVRRRVIAAVAAVVLLVAGVLLYAFRDLMWPFVGADGCTATSGDDEVRLTLDEAQRAGRSVASAVRHGEPKAAVVDMSDGDTGIDDEDAKIVAAAMQERAAFTCELYVNADEASDRLGPNGLVGRAERVRRDIESTFGDLPTGGYAPGGVTTGHMSGSAHYEGRAVDVFFRPINATNNRRGWTLAQYLVSQARRLKIQTVIYDDRIWADYLSGEGWRDYDVPTNSGSQAILEHRDHVHVDVYD